MASFDNVYVGWGGIVVEVFVGEDREAIVAQVKGTLRRGDEEVGETCWGDSGERNEPCTHQMRLVFRTFIMMH
jgi:hypothetical protein